MIKPKGEWWNAEDKFKAYYLMLRWHCEMPALEAFRMAKKNFTDYPDFFNSPFSALRKAINQKRES